MLENSESFIQRNVRLDEQPTPIGRKDAPLVKRILKNRILLGLILIILFSAVAVPLLYWATYDLQTFDDGKDYICQIDANYRVPCGNVNTSLNTCEKKQCCYDNLVFECFHSVPSNYAYTYDGSVFRPTQAESPYRNKVVPELKISYTEEVEHLRVILHDSSVDIPQIQTRHYTVTKYYEKLAVEVFRTSGERILTTGFGPLIASDGYWEWTIQLTTEYLFGLGQVYIDTNQTVSKVIYNNENDHHTIPTFMAYNNGMFHGVIVDHDGPLEITILPSKLIMLKSLVGRQIILNLFPGPTPKDVMLQQRNFAFDFQPNWIYEPQICRRGEINLPAAIDEYKKAVSMESGISYGVDCYNENLAIMLIQEQDDAVLDKLKLEIDALKTTRKFIMPLTPHVPVGNNLMYNRANDLNVLYKNSTGQIYIGKYKTIDVAFLDMSSQNIDAWMLEFMELLKKIGNPDGFTLIDNWPAEDTYKMEDGAFLYINENITRAMSHTLPWNLKDSQSNEHMRTHSKYGSNHVKLVQKHAENKPIFTSSYHYGLNNPVLVRNVNTTWTSFRQSMITNLYHSLFVHPLIASPVCGSNHYKTPFEEHVCIRWYLMAATMPLVTATTDWPLDEDGVLSFGGLIAKDALKKRQELAHYFNYFLKKEEPATRPMLYDFYSDNKTFSLEEQYMIGDSLLVAQPVYPTYLLRVYLPPSDNWYEFWGGTFHHGRGWTMLNIIESDWVMFIRGGKIVPLKIDEASGATFKLIAALNCTEDCKADGVLQFQDSTLNLTIKNNNTLIISNILQVKNEINCDEPIMPNVISSVNTYSEKGPQIFELAIDLCVASDDEVSIDMQ